MRCIALALATVAILATPLWAQGDGLSAFERAQREADIARQRTNAQVGELLSAATKALSEGRFADAELSVQTARRMVKSSDNLTADEQTALLANVNRLGDEIVARLAASQQERQQKAADEIAERERQRRAADALFQERQVESQWAQLRQFESRREYDQALEQAQALTRQHPEDTAARLAQWDLEYKARLAEQIAVRLGYRTESRGTLAQVDEAATPYTELYRYPPADQWEAMSVKRLTRVARELGYDTDARVQAIQLDKRIDLNVNAVSLPNVLTYLSEAGGVPIIADPRIEADTGVVLADQAVTLDVRQLTVRQILDMIVADPLGWRIDEGNVVVSSKEKANPLKTITYPIQHMTAEIPDFGKTVPRMNFDTLSQGGDNSSSSSPLFGDMTTTEDSGPPPQDKIKELIVRFVKGDHVAAWEDMGGPATIEYYNGTLIISQTEAGHRKVAALLARL